MAYRGQGDVESAALFPHGAFLSNPGCPSGAQTCSAALAHDLCRGRVGGGQEPDSEGVRRVCDARRPARDHRAEDRRHGAASRTTRASGAAASLRSLRVRRMPGYANYEQWISGTKLEQRVSLEDYSVSNRGLRSGLVGTPEFIAERLDAFERVGV